MYCRCLLVTTAVAAETSSFIITKIQDNEAMSTKPYKIRVDNSQTRQNRQQLEAIIKYLNDNTDAEIGLNENLEMDADTGNYKVDEIMELAQKNYDTRVTMDLKIPESPVRIHVIKNPEILEQYVKASRRRSSASTSSESSDSSDSDWNRRRNADYNYDKNDKDNNDSHENNKRKKSSMKGNINFKISRDKKNSKRNQDIKESDKYDDDPIKQTELEPRSPKKRFDDVEDTWKIITKDQWKDNSKDTTDSNDKKTPKSRRPESKSKKAQKDFEAVKQKKWKKKNSWEIDDDGWKTTRRAKKRKEYDSSEMKFTKNTYDYSPHRVKTTKKYDDDWGKNKYTKKTTSSWDKLTTTRNSWVNPVRKKQPRTRDTYVKPVGRFGGMGMGMGSFHGRTPIPFVGKKGIYEEN